MYSILLLFFFKSEDKFWLSNIWIEDYYESSPPKATTNMDLQWGKIKNSKMYVRLCTQGGGEEEEVEEEKIFFSVAADIWNLTVRRLTFIARVN